MGHVAHIGRRELKTGLWWGSLTESTLRPRRRWVDNVTVDLIEVGREDVDWIHLAQARYI
jgi:hypothetical protein